MSNRQIHLETEWVKLAWLYFLPQLSGLCSAAVTSLLLCYFFSSSFHDSKIEKCTQFTASRPNKHAGGALKTAADWLIKKENPIYALTFHIPGPVWYAWFNTEFLNLTWGGAYCQASESKSLNPSVSVRSWSLPLSAGAEQVAPQSSADVKTKWRRPIPFIPAPQLLCVLVSPHKHTHTRTQTHTHLVFHLFR